MSNESKAELAYQHILSAGRASAEEISAAVPGLAVKNVAATLRSRVRTGLLKVEVVRGVMHMKNVYIPTAKALQIEGISPKTTEIPVANTPAMTSHLRTGPKFGPGAAGGPIRNTGPDRNKGTPVVLGNSPRALAPDRGTELASAPVLGAECPAAQRQSTATHEAIQMAADLRSEQEADLARRKRPAFWLSDNGGMLIEDPAKTIFLEPSDTHRLYKLLTGCVQLQEALHEA